MRKIKIILGLLFLSVVAGVSFTSCQKDSGNSGGNTLNSQQSIEVQNSDAQDALADKTEEDVDSKLDELQNSNYAASNLKSTLSDPTDTVIITVDHPDTTTFPKVVTLTYYSYVDSCANESLIKNGTIIVHISLANAQYPRLVTRSFEFDNFSVTTDSTTVILNGTRTVVRSADINRVYSLETARISVIDHITAALTYAIVPTGQTDTLTFTRNVDKVRTAVCYFINVNYKKNEPAYNFAHLHFRHMPSFDTLSYTGTVTGINEKGDSYTKTITSKLNVTTYKGSLIISSGSMSFSSGSNSFTIDFRQDPSHPHFTQVTVTNTVTGDTRTFDRRFGRVFRRWW